jgi:hypothetical protein
MAYYIFLKSLTSLEEFRKNPHVKIPPKSPCANFQSLGIFKISNFIQKRIFPITFGPLGLSAQSFFLPADFPSLPHWATASRLAQPTARPPGQAQSDRTGPFSKLVRFHYLFDFVACPFSPLQNLSDSA